MSARHPAPWRAEGRDNGKRGRQRREFWAVLDHSEFFVAEGLDETTAREICAAVNERDRLRDIVRRLCDELEGHYYEPQSMNDHSIIREARAAIGEGE